MIADMVFAVFGALMAYSATSDLLTMKIPNRVSIALIAIFLLFALFVSSPVDLIVRNAACSALVLLICFSFFCFGWIGGGDAKLASATSLWIGWSGLLDYLFLASLFGGGLAVVLVVLRKLPIPQRFLAREWVRRLMREDSGLPYGVALAAAGIAVFPTSILWAELAARQ